MQKSTARAAQELPADEERKKRPTLQIELPGRRKDQQAMLAELGLSDDPEALIAMRVVFMQLRGRISLGHARSLLWRDYGFGLVRKAGRIHAHLLRQAFAKLEQAQRRSMPA